MKQSLQVGTYGGGQVELIPAEHANKNEDSRIEWVTSLAAVSRGKDKSNNPEVRYKSLMREAEGNMPSRPLEFLPVVMDKDEFLKITSHATGIRRHIMRFSHYANNKIYTNMRALLYAGISYEDIPYNDEIKEFVAFKINSPMFVWAQIVTHTMLSTESQSDRVSEQNRYWLPEDLPDKIELLGKDVSYANEVIEQIYNDVEDIADAIAGEEIPADADSFISYMTRIASQNDIQQLLKGIGYPREVWSRAPYYFKMKKFVITGWINDDLAWPHFLRERNAYADDGGPKNWTQPETAKYAKSIRQILELNKKISKSQILGEEL
jgi:hypothetical protein